MSTVIKRFLNYVSYDTQADENSTFVPSTSGQREFAKVLAAELKELGLSQVTLDELSYLYAVIPANTDKVVPAIGFIAHMDTCPDISGQGVKPQTIENYPGGDIKLNSEKNILLSPTAFPELKQYTGKTLITTDGTTLLGADDKAGVAVIMTMAEFLVHHPEIPHGKICIGFTPDEEIGRGADHFDVNRFGADFAYTVDGGELGELEFENFNAAKAIITVRGRNVHPGHAKNKMVNSLLLAQEFISLLPSQETPAQTEGYEGFYHLNDMHGTVEETVLHYIIRDFDEETFAQRQETIRNHIKALNQTYGEGTFNVELTEQYRNMKEKIEPVMHIIETASQAMEEVGVTPKIKPIRGGTDGARLSFMGLPTPNLFTGGHNFHGKYEFIPTFALEKSVEVVLKIIELYAKSKEIES